jgi:hypothetical protein
MFFVLKRLELGFKDEGYYNFRLQLVDVEFSAVPVCIAEQWWHGEFHADAGKSASASHYQQGQGLGAIPLLVQYSFSVNVSFVAMPHLTLQKNVD